MFLCCEAQAQSASKPKPPRKPRAEASSTAPATNTVEISKEFMPVARKAYQSLENLNEHFWEDYASDAAWTPRQMEAEKARDDLEALSNTPTEKYISSSLRVALFAVSGWRSILINAEKLGPDGVQEQRDHARSALKNIFGPCYYSFKELAITGVRKKDSQCGRG
jgi:hypothetical protein